MTITADELRAYRAAHRDELLAAIADAPPPPPEAIEMARATKCPIPALYAAEEWARIARELGRARAPRD